MRFYQVNPTQDPRWAELADRHPRGSVYHSVAWLNALRRTYQYEPVAFTTSSPREDLSNGIVFCHVDSWLTGHRLVSLPFSDHCEPLFDSAEDVTFLIRYLQTNLEREAWKYLEVRPIDINFGKTQNGIGMAPAAKHFIHTLDLRPDLDEIFRSLDKDSVQRPLQQARQAGLIEKCGVSWVLLKDFYRLLVVSKDRHYAPPPPYAWFRNLIDCQRNALEIRVAYLEKTPIAAILTLLFRDVVYYKYGCSDARFHNYGAMPWLLWRAIAAAKSNGAVEFDMGRTEETNSDLLAFKNHWAPAPKRLVYWRYPDSSLSLGSAGGWKHKLAKGAFSCVPTAFLPVTGRLLYRHIVQE